MLDWFYLKDIRLTEDNDKTSIHIYLDENETTPDERTDLRPNGFTRESVSMLKPHAFAGDPDFLKSKSNQLTFLKYKCSSVNFAKENYENPQKSFAEQRLLLILRKKITKIRKNNTIFLTWASAMHSSVSGSKRRPT